MPISFNECDWRPTKVVRSIRAVKSSTEVVNVELDAGTAFLKGMGNPMGNECLALELVGTRLARLSGLFVPDYAVIDHDLLELQRVSGEIVGFGPAFVSMALPGHPGGGTAFLSRIANPYDIPLLVAFDTWVTNIDRCPPPDPFHPPPNWDNIFFVPISAGGYKMTVFDHTHCFTNDTLDDALADRRYVADDRVYGAFPEFNELLTEDALRRAVQSIRSVDDNTIRGVVESVPQAWGPSSNSRSEWIAQIVDRRDRLEKILLDRLIPQRVMELG